MRLTCEHCHNAIELVDTEGAGEVLCPACGVAFRSDIESTVSWQGLGGRRFGRFVLENAVGSGGFGTVYRARDPGLDRTVAVKIPRADRLGGQDDRARFLREGRSVARLRHDAIVPVHEVGEADGVPYLVSDFIEGPSLHDVLTAREFPPREAAEVVAKVADALHYAHGQGVVHRDVKPANLLFDAGGKPHLVDFGLARRDEVDVTMSQDGQILGTPAYMSPEQARGESNRVDGRSDIFSLGVVLYRLLAGELPFRGNTRMTLHQIENVDPRPPSRLNKQVPRDLQTVCLKALEKAPAGRYQTAGALAEDLRRWLRGEPIQARPVGRLERTWRWCRRQPALAVSGATISLLVVAVAVVWVVAAADKQVAKKAVDDANQAAEEEKKKAVEAGVPVISRPDRVHVRATPQTQRADLTKLGRGLSQDLSWNVYLPREGRFRLVTHLTGVPGPDGFPTRGSGFRWEVEFDPDSSGKTSLISVEFVNDPNFCWLLRIAGVNRHAVSPCIPRDYTREFKQKEIKEENPGDPSWTVVDHRLIQGTKGTNSAGTEANRLLLYWWERSEILIPSHRPVPGSKPVTVLMIWVEPIPPGERKSPDEGGR